MKISRRRFFGRTGIMAASIAALCGINSQYSIAQEKIPEDKTFLIHPIGTVKRKGKRTMIVLDPKYVPGLLRMEKLSYVNVLYWFDRNDNPEKRSILQVHPQGNKKNPLTGVFATRSPVRPNLIAISKCKILSIKENVVEIDKIDAFNNSPVIDLKC